MDPVTQISPPEPALSSLRPGFRAASYNIRKCIGTDRRRDPGRIVKVIDALDADVIALQEADRRLGRRPAALPHALVSEAGYMALDLGRGLSLGWHGNALLLRPGIVVENVALRDLPGFEPRGALTADVTMAGHGLRVVALHLGLRAADRQRQVADIAAWLADMPARPTLVLGDFNAWGAGPAWPGLSLLAPGHSFHSRWRLAPLDRIGHCDRLTPVATGMADDRLARRASDHLPIWADFDWTGATRNAAPTRDAALDG